MPAGALEGKNPSQGFLEKNSNGVPKSGAKSDKIEDKINKIGVGPSQVYDYKEKSKFGEVMVALRGHFLS